MATSRPLPPGRRGTGARPPAAMHALPDPQLLHAPSGAASPARNASESIEKRQEQPPPAWQHAAPAARAPAHSWEQRASWSTPVAKLGTQAAQPARTAASAPSPTPAKASGFLAARAKFDAKPAAPAPTPPPTKPSRFIISAPSVTTSSTGSAPPAWRAALASPASAPKPPAELTPSSSVKALISRLNTPGAAAKTDKASTTPAGRSPRFPHGAASASPAPQQRTAPATQPPTPSTALTPVQKPIAHASKPAEVVSPVVYAPKPFKAPMPVKEAKPVAYPSWKAPAPAAPVIAPQPRSAVATPPATLPPAPPTVTAVVSPPAVSPPPAAASSLPQSRVAVASSTSTPEFHPINLLLPVTSVPLVPRKMDCVYDDAAAEMHKNVMKVVKKLFRKTKPRVDDFKTNAKLFGTGFMDAEEYLESLIKQFSALRALQLVPCLVSIQPDAAKRENLLYAARGFRLRNMDDLKVQCDQPVPVESLPRLSSSESITSTVSTVSTISQAPVDVVASGIDKTHEHATDSVVTSVEHPKPTASTSEGSISIEREDIGAKYGTEVIAPARVEKLEPPAEAVNSVTEEAEVKTTSSKPEAETDGESSVADPVTAASESSDLDGSVQDEGIQVAEPEAGPSTEAEAATPEKLEPRMDQQNDVEVATKAVPVAAEPSRPTRSDSLTSSDDEDDETPAKQPVGSNTAQPSDSQAIHHVKSDQDKDLFSGSLEPVVAVQTHSSTANANAVDDLDSIDAFTLFGPASPSRSPSSSTSEQPASISKPRKSVTWGTTQAKEIPARKVSPPPIPMIFGLATAGAYADSDSDSDSDADFA